MRRECGGNEALLRLLTLHSQAVARKALQIAVGLRGRGRFDLDTQFVYEAAMLHDVGITRCNAPSIHCYGALPYICHGVEGRKILEGYGLPAHALVCERHTGAGLTKEDIERQGLPLPLRDMTPQTAAERLICYADKFYSKSSHPLEEKSLERVRASMAKHGGETLRRFDLLHEEFFGGVRS